MTKGHYISRKNIIYLFYTYIQPDKPSQTDGLIMDENDNLYLTEITKNLISVWSPSSGEGLGSQSRVLAQDNTTMIWPDTLAIDDLGFLWATTRGWPIDRNSNAVIRINIGAKSNLH